MFAYKTIKTLIVDFKEIKNVCKAIIHIISITAICVLISKAQSIPVTSVPNSKNVEHLKSEEGYDKVKVVVQYANSRNDGEVRITFPNGVTIPVDILEGHAIDISGYYKVVGNNWYRLSAVADFSTNINGSRFHQYAAGNQFAIKLFNNRVEPFVQLVLGAYRFEDSRTEFFKQLSGGVDINIGEHFGVRSFQYGKRYVNNTPFNNIVISTGLFVKF